MVPGCFERGEFSFFPFCTGRLGKKGIVPHSVVGLPVFLVFLLTCVWAGPAVGSHTGERCWPLLAGLWRAFAPPMQPWRAEGDVPTAADLNLYWGWKSRVGWHCDDERCLGSGRRSSLSR